MLVALFMVESTETDQSICPAASPLPEALHCSIPRPVGSETTLPLPESLPRTELCRQADPARRGVAIPIDDALNNLPVVPERAAPRPV